MNQATHFLDGSHIYGTNSREAAALRQSTGGLLKTESINGEEFPPLTVNAKERCMIEDGREICFQTGEQIPNYLLILILLINKRVTQGRLNNKFVTLSPVHNYFIRLDYLFMFHDSYKKYEDKNVLESNCSYAINVIVFSRVVNYTQILLGIYLLLLIERSIYTFLV